MAYPKSLRRPDTEKRVNKALDALDSIFAIGRGTVEYFKQQSNLMGKAINQFEEAVGELFSPDDVKPETILEAEEGAEKPTAIHPKRARGSG